MIHLSNSLKYYKREDVQRAILEHAADKEVAARFNDNFGKRPDILTYPNDVLELAKQGATSFHCSEELWTNPLQLQPQMPKKELDRLRKGWDLLLDIDCAFLEYSKIASDLIINALQELGIRSITAKFSGNKGFHVAVPWEAFPESVHGKETRELFPEAPKKIALYLKERIKKSLGRRVLELEKNNFKAIAEKTGKELKEITIVKEGESRQQVELNTEPFLAIDTLLISSRHMYRMPYSLHEKSGLASIPVDVNNVTSFSKEEAVPEKVVAGRHKFVDRQNVRQNEAEKLLLQAYDFTAEDAATAKRYAKYFEKDARAYDSSREEAGKIPQQYFPPCIRKMLEGVADGRKRALFVLVNFLGSCNYSNDEIKTIIAEWNQKNKEPLPHLYVESQLSYNRQKAEKVLPPNCGNASYYSEIGIECTPECGTCKNPVAEAKQIYRKAVKIATAAPAEEKPKRRKTHSNL